jgi:hypothetical protein
MQIHDFPWCTLQWGHMVPLHPIIKPRQRQRVHYVCDGQGKVATDALDCLNDRYGKGTVHVASTGSVGPAREWGMRQERRMPGYTTN